MTTGTPAGGAGVTKNDNSGMWLKTLKSGRKACGVAGEVASSVSVTANQTARLRDSGEATRVAGLAWQQQGHAFGKTSNSRALSPVDT
eukprot:350044-Chlamydomonas_euryale.AAC.3